MDPQFGLAHNNLGVAYLEQDRLYDAALRFDVAARLLPERAEPLINLGLLLEEAGRLDDAIERYREALRRETDEPRATGNLARAKLRRGDNDAELTRLLQRLRDDPRPGWRVWAQNRLPAAASAGEALDPVGADGQLGAGRDGVEGVAPPPPPPVAEVTPEG